MKRRELIQAAMATALFGGSSGHVRAADAVVKQLDRFGGWRGKRFKATGFFRVEKDKRWWLVTPEGNAFLSFGINHLHPDWWKQEYNRQAWRKRLGIKDLNSSEFAPALKAWFLQTCREYGFRWVLT